MYHLVSDFNLHRRILHSFLPSNGSDPLGRRSVSIPLYIMFQNKGRRTDLYGTSQVVRYSLDLSSEAQQSRLSIKNSRTIRIRYTNDFFPCRRVKGVFYVERYHPITFISFNSRFSQISHQIDRIDRFTESNLRPR